MILEELVLHNFGVYRGRQSISLAPPSQQKPVILIGGMNGGGKTTILDALLLALYGKFARCSGRGSLAYEEFLRRSIHRTIDPAEGAALEVQFRHVSEGTPHIYRIHRSWSASGTGVKERFEALLDGKFDPVLSESWAEHVETFIPSRISSLFFFDGEKIESLADLENSRQLLGVAIRSLLGLDLVDRLVTDLIVLERRKRVDAGPNPDSVAIEEAGDGVQRAEAARERLLEERAGAQNVLDRHEKSLREIELRFRQEGGELFVQRASLERERGATESQIERLEEELRELAAGPAPLLLVRTMLRVASRQATTEEDLQNAHQFSRILRERDRQTIAKAINLGLQKDTATILAEFLEQDRSKRGPVQSLKAYLNLDRETRERIDKLLNSGLGEVFSRSRGLIAQCEALQTVLGDLERKLARIPDQDAIATLLEQLTTTRGLVEQVSARVSALDGELEHVRSEIEHKRSRLLRLLEGKVEAELEIDDSRRVAAYSARVRDTLKRFRVAMVQRNLHRIETLVLESLHRLLRKRSLVADLKIDPESFSIELRGSNGSNISPERLSAGERQLLAVALLWGLARASGRPLPAIIDTPLGRLDSGHRTYLVDRYFPSASHQVLLLSTDEEINQHYYEKLKPFVGRSYRLEFDDATETTQIQQGYFW